MTATNTSKTGSKKLPAIITICVTLVLLAAVGGWVYMQKQQIAQRDRQLQQEKQLKEYEQDQINQRQKRDSSNSIICMKYSTC